MRGYRVEIWLFGLLDKIWVGMFDFLDKVMWVYDLFFYFIGKDFYYYLYFEKYFFMCFFLRLLKDFV